MIFALLLFIILVTGLVTGLLLPLFILLIAQTFMVMAACWLVLGRFSFWNSLKAIAITNFVFILALIACSLAVSVFMHLIPMVLLLPVAFFVVLWITVQTFARHLHTSYGQAIAIGVLYLVISTLVSWWWAPHNVMPYMPMHHSHQGIFI